MRVASYCGAIVIWSMTTVSAEAQSLLPEPTLAPEVRALMAISRSAARGVEAVPDYMCGQTVRRTQTNAESRAKIQKLMARRDAKERQFRVQNDFADTVRLEVAVVEGKEIYSWPGAEFKPVPLSELIGFGVTASGSFASFVKALFVNESGRIRYSGEERDTDGRELLRYDYQVAQMRSGYSVGTAGGSAIVGYEGSFWALKDELRLVRLTMEGVDIPPKLGLKSLSTEIRYDLISVGAEGFVLPVSATYTLVGWDGSLKTNEAGFHDCRKFGAVSDVSFDLTEDLPADESARLPQTLQVPVGTVLPVRLVGAISSERSQVGDLVEGRLRSKATVGGRVVAPKGALLKGRLRRLHRIGDRESPHYAISLEFTELRTDSESAKIQTELVRIQADEAVTRAVDMAAQVKTWRRDSAFGLSSGDALEKTTVIEDGDDGLAGTDSIYVRGEDFTIPKGFAMTWRVVAKKP